MKKIMLLVLLTGTIKQNYAQNAFTVPDTLFKYGYEIPLDKGERMRIELRSQKDMSLLQNLDTISRIFLDDLKRFRDTIKNFGYTHRIEYLNEGYTKKINIAQHLPASARFVIIAGVESSLKTEQDSIIITGVLGGPADRFNKSYKHFYRLSFFLNDLYDLADYIGTLEKKTGDLRNPSSPFYQDALVQNSPGKSAEKTSSVYGNNKLVLRMSADVQNYKDRFVPSATLGLALVSYGRYVRDYGISTEFHYHFARDADGKLRSLVSDFIAISYGQAKIRPDGVMNASLFPFVSLSYLVSRKEDDYDKNTFRLGLGRIAVFNGSTKIEPSFYFNDFFKHVTPSLRLVQRF